MDSNTIRVLLAKRLLNDLPNLLGRDLIVWGAGSTALYAQEGIQRFSKTHPWMKIAAYCDSNSRKWGETFCGKIVLSPKQLERRYPVEKREDSVFILICSHQKNAIMEIRDWLKSNNFAFCLLDEMILKFEAEKVLNCFDLLYDYKSKLVYQKLIFAYFAGFIESKELEYETKAYFSHPMLSEKRQMETFVDCGAYTGDTLKLFIDFSKGKFRRYIAFEADKCNYEKLVKVAKQLQQQWLLPETKFQLNCCAVSDRIGTLCYIRDAVGEGLGTRVVHTSELKNDVCEVTSLDKFIKKPYSFLKADIEGFEYRMICGAREGIRKYHPLIAISIYHTVVDMYSILLLIHEIEPKYLFAVMHHTETFNDSALYCWCEE